MKYLNCICILFLLSGCHNSHPAIGTWSKCNKDGSYWEYKITDQSILILNTFNDEVWHYKVQIVDTSLLLSKFQNGPSLMFNNDTLVTIKQTEGKIVLKSTYTWDTYEFNKREFDFEPIDSTHLETWKAKVISDFKKRAELMSCPDLRTEEEKIIPLLELDDSEEEIPIIELDN